jgi:two-component system response regulator LytT
MCCGYGRTATTASCAWSIGRSELHDKSLAALTAVLPPDFVRCHRSYLVNLRHIRALHAASGSRYWLSLVGGGDLAVGRAHVASLREQPGVDG